MQEAAVRKQLNELIQLITGSPLTGQPVGSLQDICPPDGPAAKGEIDATLGHLRLQTKYLLFDLEATRRENRYLRQMLESRHRRDVDDLKGGGDGL